MDTSSKKPSIVWGARFSIFFVLAMLGMLLGLSTLSGLAKPLLVQPDPAPLYSYETGVEGWSGSIVSNNPGGTVAITTTHVTDGVQALQINSLPDQGAGDDGDGGFFSVQPSPALDFTGYSEFKFDLHATTAVTVFVAFQTGGWANWVQSADYGLAPGDHTVIIDLDTISGGGRLVNDERIDAIHIYYNAVGTFVQDYVRLEGYVPPPTNTPTPTLGPTVTPLVNLPGLRVVGPNLYDHCGEKILLRGVNKMVIWTDINGNSFPEIAKTGANSVRIVWLPTGDPAQLDAVIQRAIDNGLIPMVGLWNTTGDWAQLTQALEYWVRPDVVAVVQKHEQYLLVNVGNEPGDQVPEEEFKTAYTYIIRRMRQEGIRTPLVIDATGWGQNIDMLQSAGPYLLAMDPDHNLIFDVHTYWPYKWGWTDARIMEEFAETAELGIPLVIGEFGNKWDNDGSVGDEIPYQLIIQEAYRYGFGYYPWEWGPGNNPQTHLNMTYDSTYDTLHDWGLEVAVSDPFSILNTSDRPYSILNGGACASGATVTPGPSPTPYNDGPTVNLVAPAFNAMIPNGGDLDMVAEADDFDGTISKVAFYVNDDLVGEDTTDPFTHTVPSVSTGEYWLGAEATDNGGATGESDQIYVIVGLPPFFSINDTVTGTGNYQFEYTGSWNIGIKEGRFHDDDHYSYTEGDCFVFRFEGTQVQMYVATAPHHGIATVSVDGDTPFDVDLYSPTAEDNVMAWQSDVLPVGSHTVEVCVSGRQNPSGTGITVSIDRMYVTSQEVEFMPLALRNSGTGWILDPTLTPTATMEPTPTPTVVPPSTRTPYPTSTPTPTPIPGCVPAPDVVVYDDSTSWGNWSWSTSVDFAYTGEVYSGTQAISVTYTAGWAALSLHTDTPIDTEGYQYVSFYVYGGTNGSNLRFYTQDSGDNDSTYYDFDAPEGAWTHITVTLEQLGSPTEISRVNFQDRGDVDSTTYYLDEIVIVGTVCETETPTALLLNDFETDTEGWEPSASVAVTTTHVTSGTQALQVNSTGGWFNNALASPLDASGWRFLEFDIYNPGSTGSVDVAIQTGSGWSWQQSPKHYPLAAGATSHVVVDLVVDFNGGVGLTDPDMVQRINIYFNAGTYVLDAVVLTNPPALYSFETGTEGWEPSASVVVTTTHATLGSQALEINSSGAWFNGTPATPLDFTGKRYLIFHVYNPGGAGSVDVAIQTGSGWSWQQSPIHYTLGANDTTLVVVDLLADFNGGAGLTDPDIVQRINIYFNAGTYVLDYVAVE